MSENTSVEIRQLKNKYIREWRKKNPDKARAIQERYWQKKLAQAQQEQEKASEQAGTDN